MDKFKNRLRYFLIGLSLGVLAVYFMFGNRGCAWLPGNRVKNMVGEKEIIVGDSILDLMQCYGLDNDHIYALLKDEGDVEFSESITDSTVKVYYIEGYFNDKSYYAEFALDEERQISEVVGVGREDEQCSSKLSNRIKSTMPLPRQDVIRILESKEFRILDKAKCQLKYYGIPEEAILKFHLDGKIEIAKSQPRKQPNPFYVISGKIADKPYEVTYIVGDNRTRIQDIEGTSPADCTEQNAE